VLLVDWVLDLNMRVVDADPYRSRTEMGSLGRLKKYDAIVLRVLRDEKDCRARPAPAPRQLQQLCRGHLVGARRAHGDRRFRSGQ
jgi:hypothetical protein